MGRSFSDRHPAGNPRNHGRCEHKPIGAWIDQSGYFCYTSGDQEQGALGTLV